MIQKRSMVRATECRKPKTKMSTLTPETDAMIEDARGKLNYPENPVSGEFARKLESQRDEWKEVAANAERAVGRAKRERDEFAKRLEEALSDKVVAQSGNVTLFHENERLRKEIADQNGNYLHVMTERDELRAKHKMHHEEAERLSLENEELCAARYQLNTIKQAFQFLTE